MSDANPDGSSERLLSAIPPGAHRVLELGWGNSRLGQAFKRYHAGVQWTCLDVAAAAPRCAVDAAGYDTIVIGGPLECLPDPGGLLGAAHVAGSSGARLVCCASNMSHVSMLERLLSGDATCGPGFSPAALMKLLLDSGWLPNLRDYQGVGHTRPEFVHAMVAAAGQIGIPPQTTARNILIQLMIFDCIKAPPVPPAEPAAFSVVVPVTNPAQLARNVMASPGLREVNAPVIEIRGASSAADALSRGAAQVLTPWLVFAHQDVYFPAGSGHALTAAFGAVPTARADEELIGFAGMRSGAPGLAEYAGLVIDRVTRFDHPADGPAVSLDEFAVAMTPRTHHRIDPALGWHLWATDLCLAAARRGARAPRIARVPLFHNSYNDGNLPAAFHQSAGTLLAKYRELRTIPTLCGILGPRGP